MDLTFSGTINKFQYCKIIPAHVGGTLPYLISRVANLSITPGFVFELEVLNKGVNFIDSCATTE